MKTGSAVSFVSVVKGGIAVEIIGAVSKSSSEEVEVRVVAVVVLSKTADLGGAENCKSLGRIPKTGEIVTAGVDRITELSKGDSGSRIMVVIDGENFVQAIETSPGRSSRKVAVTLVNIRGVDENTSSATEIVISRNGCRLVKEDQEE